MRRETAVPAPLKVAIAGVGGRGLAHAEVVSAPDVPTRLVGVWDRSADRVEPVAGRFGVPAARSVAELVERTGADLIVLATHPDARVEPVRDAVAAGATALLVEKPIALDEAGLDRLAAAAGDALLAVNTQYRWTRHWVRAFDALAAGALGTVRSITASTGVHLLDQGPHLLDLVLAAAEAGGVGAPDLVEAHGSAPVRYGRAEVPNDVVATIDAGPVRTTLRTGDAAPRVPGEDVVWFQQQIEVVGTAGRLHVTLNRGGELTVEGRTERFSTAWPADDLVAQAALYRDLAAALTGSGRDAFPTRLEVAAGRARLLFALLRSARSGRPVEVAASTSAGSPR